MSLVGRGNVHDPVQRTSGETQTPRCLMGNPPAERDPRKHRQAHDRHHPQRKIHPGEKGNGSLRGQLASRRGQPAPIYWSLQKTGRCPRPGTQRSGLVPFQVIFDWFFSFLTPPRFRIRSHFTHGRVQGQPLCHSGLGRLLHQQDLSRMRIGVLHLERRTRSPCFLHSHSLQDVARQGQADRQFRVPQEPRTHVPTLCPRDLSRPPDTGTPGQGHSPRIQCKSTEQ